ncbi:hypothetical protein V5799_025079 [Amblyomma americanum]|uniref:Alcohol dehydrogenase transcription factor myb/sant-like protein n=1 Tax=Amblyomma americanum TaxID=6943 RepID=A0AAQ4EA80_AMBAM
MAALRAHAGGACARAVPAAARGGAVVGRALCQSPPERRGRRWHAAPKLEPDADDQCPAWPFDRVRAMASFNEKLVQEVKKHKQLWDQQSKLHKEAGYREAAWMEIAAALVVTVEECQTRWRTIRDAYLKRKKRRRIDPKGQWSVLDRELGFLDHFLRPRTTEKKQTNLDWAFRTTRSNEHRRERSQHGGAASACWRCLCTCGSRGSSWWRCGGHRCLSPHRKRRGRRWHAAPKPDPDDDDQYSVPSGPRNGLLQREARPGGEEAHAALGPALQAAQGGRLPGGRLDGNRRRAGRDRSTSCCIWSKPSAATSVEECQTRWRTLRDTYLKRKKRRRIDPKGQWSVLDRELGFLDDFLRPRTRRSTLNAAAPADVEVKQEQPGEDAEMREAGVAAAAAPPQSCPLAMRPAAVMPHRLAAGGAAAQALSSDPEELFCLSLAARLKRLLPRERHMARMKMLQTLHDLESGENIGEFALGDP